jgi:glutamate carboxypeptidase
MSYQIQNLARPALRRQKQLLALIQALVELESPSENKPAVDRCLDLVEQRAAALGARIKRHRFRHAPDVLEARFDPPRQSRSKNPSRKKPTLLLGHVDTVWPLGTLSRKPFRIAKGRAFGPGIFDMKTGVAMALTAVELLQLERQLARPLILLLVGDEETGSHASRSVTEKVAKQCEQVYVLEPAQGPGGAFKTSRKGVAAYRLHVTGVAAHSGLNFEQGHSAVSELAGLIGEIEGWTDLARGITVNVGTIHGGTRSNVVPAEAWAEVDVRIARMADFPKLHRRFLGLRTRDRACVLKVEGELNRPPMERTPSTAALFRRAATLADAMGFSLQESAAGGGSDGNFTSALGISTLDGMGAVGEGAHAENESVVLQALAPRTALLAAMLCEV